MAQVDKRKNGLPVEKGPLCFAGGGDEVDMLVVEIRQGIDTQMLTFEGFSSAQVSERRKVGICSLRGCWSRGGGSGMEIVEWKVVKGSWGG